MNATDDKPQITQLCACRAGLAAGIVWGLCLLLLGIITLFTETYCHQIVELLGNMYAGYKPDSFGGALLGLVWGLDGGFIGVTIAVLIYNALAGRGACCCRGKSAAQACQSPPAE